MSHSDTPACIQQPFVGRLFSVLTRQKTTSILPLVNDTVILVELAPGIEFKRRVYRTAPDSGIAKGPGKETPHYGFVSQTKMVESI